MATDRVSICYYTSDDPRGRFLDLMVFVKQELRGIKADAQERYHHRTAQLSEDAVEALEETWQVALHECTDPAEPYSSEQGVKHISEATEEADFDFELRRHFGWLRQNWRSLLPNN